MTVALFSYNEGSEGAKELSKALGIKRIKHQGSKFAGDKRKVVINWGASVVPEEVSKCTIINNPRLIGPMSNKLKFFELMDDHDDVPLPEWTTDKNVALEWWGEPDGIVVERHKLTGHSGEGIRLSGRTMGVDIHNAPLYTKYTPKKDEYRVHFFRGNVIDVQQKKKRLDFDGEANFKVRNHANGFIYARENLNIPVAVRDAALACGRACGLDFGAVDVIYNMRADKALCLEVNTAPGLAGETVNIYANAFKRYLD